MKDFFSERLRYLRLDQGITQSFLAECLGIGQTAVANYEKGVRLPDLDMISRIADYFFVSVDYLLGREHEYKKTFSSASGSRRKELPYHFDDYMDALLKMDKVLIQAIVNALIDDGINSGDFYHNYVERALTLTGDLWEKGDLAVWKEHYISELLLEHISMIKSRLYLNLYDIPPILALIPGDGMHTIGLRILSNLLEAEGYPVIFLGSNVPADSILAMIEINQSNTILMSVSMQYHVSSAKLLIDTIKKTYMSNSPKILVGGAGFRYLEDPASECGADAYCNNLTDIIVELNASAMAARGET